MVRVNVVAGFLGAGKTTTLLDQIARRGGERLAVLVNDFGESAIDSSLVQGEGDLRVAEIRGACVCCTAPEGFSDALGMLLDEVKPERIFVEPTGIARPADIVDTIRRGPHAARVTLGPLVVLVDPACLDDDALRQEQIEAADVLVANRCDLASAAELEGFRAHVKELWPGPLTVLETSQGKVPEALFEWPDAQERSPSARHHHHGHTPEHAFTALSLAWEPEQIFSRARLVAALESLRGLDRLKGMVRTEEGVFLVEIAGARIHERPTSYRRDSRVDLISKDAALLSHAQTLLEAALCRPEELQERPGLLEIVRPDGTRVELDRALLGSLPDPVSDVSVLLPKRCGAAARVVELVRHVGLPPTADVVVVASDGYATPAVPLSGLQAAVLLHTLDGEALPTEHGGPFRLLIPGDAGPGGPCANVKGVVRIVVREGS